MIFGDQPLIPFEQGLDIRDGGLGILEFSLKHSNIWSSFLPFSFHLCSFLPVWLSFPVPPYCLAVLFEASNRHHNIQGIIHPSFDICLCFFSIGFCQFFSIFISGKPLIPVDLFRDEVKGRKPCCSHYIKTPVCYFGKPTFLNLVSRASSSNDLWNHHHLMLIAFLWFNIHLLVIFLSIISSSSLSSLFIFLFLISFLMYFQI